jgi:hypothetical protein
VNHPEKGNIVMCFADLVFDFRSGYPEHPEWLMMEVTNEHLTEQEYQELLKKH